MGLDALLSRLENRRHETPETPCNLAGVSANPALSLARTLETPETPQIDNGGRDARKASPGDTATASRWWLLHYPDREPVEVASFPPATHADILERHPEAIAAEPINQGATCPAWKASIAADLEALIQRAGAFYEYSTDDWQLIRDVARRDPEGLRLALLSDSFIGGMP